MSESDKLKNSFKQLEEEQEKQYSSNLNRVKDSIDSNLGGLSFFTNIIELYFARLGSYVVNMTGGDSSKDENES